MATSRVRCGSAHTPPKGQTAPAKPPRHARREIILTTIRLRLDGKAERGWVQWIAFIVFCCNIN